MAKTSGLTVRQHEREGIELPIEFAIDAAHHAQVRFSPASSAASANLVRGTAVDVSSGGMGLRCRQFLPRMCEGTLRVYMPAPGQPNGEGPAAGPLALEQRVKVRRVFQVDREQLYSVGVAFVNPDSALEQKISAILSRLAPGPKRSPEGAGRA